jgi:hypothetical protein
MASILKETFLREREIKNSSSKYEWSKTFKDQNFGQTKIKQVLEQ